MMSWLTNWFHEHRKAFGAAAVAALAMFLKDSDLLRHVGSMTADDWWQILGLFIAAAGLTGVIPNRNYVKVTGSDRNKV